MSCGIAVLKNLMGFGWITSASASVVLVMVVMMMQTKTRAPHPSANANANVNGNVYLIITHIKFKSIILICESQQFANVVREQSQFNFVFVHVVEDANVLANYCNGAILGGFIEQVRVFDVAEVVVQNVHDGIALVVQLVQVRNARRNRLARAQAVGRVIVKLAKPDVGAQLVGQLQRNGQSHNFEFFQVIDENAHRLVAHFQYELGGVVAHCDVLTVAYFVQNAFHALRVDGVDFEDDLPRLQVVNDFLHIGAGRNEAHVVPILVNAVAKHLLALFVDGVHVVQQHEFFFAGNERPRLAKDFHVGAVVLDALVLQAVEHHDVFGVVVVAVVFADDGIDQRRFTGTRVAHNEQVQFVHLMERPEKIGHHGRQLFKIHQSQRLVLVDEGHIVGIHDHGHGLCIIIAIFL